MRRDELEDEGMQTKAVHASDEFNHTNAISPPIWQTSTFSADSAEQFAEIASSRKPRDFYTRYGNPTHAQVEATMAALEGGEAALVTGSGMGAVFLAVMSGLRSGDHVVAQKNVYAATTVLFSDIAPRWGIEVSLVDQMKTDEFAASIRPNTKIIYAETPSNPLIRLTDLSALADMAKGRGITTIVDSTLATPINLRPIEFGIDVVIHSGTKYLGGHDDLSAGVIVSTKEFINRMWEFMLVAGPVLNPFDGWLLLRGLRTLGVRVERHNSNALAVARYLESHPAVERVNHPGLESHPQYQLGRRQMQGFGGTMSVELKDGFDAAEKFIRALRLAKRAASLGGTGTLVVHPAAMWGFQVSPEQRRATGISEGLVRVSVGLEDESDLIRDFEQALAKAVKD